jgi:hypothetical protein
MNAAIFTLENRSVDVTALAQIKAPYARAFVSTLGGAERATLMLTVSLDEQNAWAHGILENSRYGRLMLERDGTLEYFSGSLPKLRKRKVKSLADAARVINAWLAKA